MKIVIIGYFTEFAKKTITNEFPPHWIIDIVTPEEVETKIADADVLIPENMQVDAALIKKANKLKFIQCGAGFDNVDIKACTEKGVLVASAAGVNAIAVAEHVISLIFAWYKNIPYLDRFMKTKQDEKQLNYSGSELYGKKIGIIGVGAVGLNIAKYCNAFGMEVLGYRGRIETTEKIKFVDLDTLYAESDIITINASLNDKTKHMINSDVFKKMKKEALLINTSRGAIIDESALITALKTGEIKGACLDVFEKEPLALESELRNFDNVILTPHTAGSPNGLKFHKRRYVFFLNNINKVIEGKEPDSLLNKL